MLVTLLIFLFPLAFSPGPGNMFFAANGARFGFAATVPANLGYHLATWVVTCAVGLGSLEAIIAFPAVFEVIKNLGALYVLWLAWCLAQAGASGAMGDAKPAGFGTGVALLLLNPKAYVIITLMFTQFLQAGAEQRIVEILSITTVFTLNNMAAFSVWAFAGDRLAGLFRDAQSARSLNRAFGVCLGGVGLWMLLV